MLPTVEGDGIHSVAELVSIKNQQRANNPVTERNLTPLDEKAVAVLRDQGLSVDDVPRPGQSVTVRNVNGLAGGGETRECFEEFSELLGPTAVQAVSAIPGMEWGGLDILLDDVTNTPYVIEVNANPGISGSEFPAWGAPSGIGAKIWQDLFSRTVPEHDPDSALRPELTSRNCLGDGKSETYALLGMFRNYLRARGYPIQLHKRGVWELKTGPMPLYFRNLYSSADLLRVGPPVDNRLALHNVLKRMGVPQMRAKVARNAVQVKRFLEELGGPATAIPTGFVSSFDRSVVKLSGDPAESSQLLFRTGRSGRRWFLQAHPEGTRFRVLLTRDRIFAVIARDGAEISQSDFDRVTDIAIRALRAVPLLDWTCVDLVLRPSPQRSIFVENFTADPIFSSKDELIAGDLDEFFEFLLQRARKSAGFMANA